MMLSAHYPVWIRCAFALSVFLCVLGVFALLHARREHAAEYFSHALREARASETVLVGGKEYRFEKGVFTGDAAAPFEAARLAYAKAAARRAPFFSLAGTDPNSLHDALGELEVLQKDLAALQPIAARARAVGRALYPIPFLRAASDAERLRLRFLETGAQEDERAYARALVRAARAYRADLARFREAFERVVAPDSPAHAAGPKIIRREGVLRAAGALFAGSANTIERMRKRNACVAGFVRSCSEEDLSFPARNALTRPSASNRLPEALSIFSEAGLRVETPEIALSASSCIKAPSLPVYTLRRSVGDYDFLMPHFIGDIRLVPTAQFPNAQYLRFLAAQGIEYAFSAPDTYYECFEYGADFGRVVASAGVSRFASSARVSAYASGDSAKDLAALESRLLSGSFSEYDASEYLRLAGEVVAAGEAPEPAEYAYASAAAEFAYLGGSLDVLIRAISVIERANIRVQEGGVDMGLDAPFLFFVRSAFPSLFMAANASVAGTPELFSQNDYPKEREPYVYASELLSGGKDLRSIAEDVRRYHEIYHP